VSSSGCRVSLQKNSEDQSAFGKVTGKSSTVVLFDLVNNKLAGIFSATVYTVVAFSALTLLIGRQEGYPAEWWGAGVVVCLERGADLHMAQQMPLPLTVSCFSKIQIGLPFWYRITRVVLDKRPLNVCVCVCTLYCHCNQPQMVHHSKIFFIKAKVQRKMTNSIGDNLKIVHYS